MPSLKTPLHSSTVTKFASKYIYLTTFLFLAFFSTCAFAESSNESSKESSKEPLRLPTLERPKIQNRFQPRAQRISGYLSAGGHIRDDYYDSLNTSLSVEYFINDHWGVGLAYQQMFTVFSDEAQTLRSSYGLVPDARPQDALFALSGLYGLGYGKMLTGHQITHFDPIIGLHFGVASAESRILPTLKLNFMPTFLLRYDLKIRLDLGLTAQLENRSRGWVFTTGFMPMISFGWGHLL